MKYYSEKLNKNFDTEKECIEAEKQLEEKEKKNKETRKEMALLVDDADKKVKEAYKEYEQAQQIAAEILEKSNKEVEDIINKAREKVKKAEQEKYEALLNFSNKYGVYTKTINSQEANERLQFFLQKFEQGLDSFLYW